jgi:hypothetical protein
MNADVISIDEDEIRLSLDMPDLVITRDELENIAYLMSKDLNNLSTDDFWCWFNDSLCYWACEVLKDKMVEERNENQRRN